MKPQGSTPKYHEKKTGKAPFPSGHHRADGKGMPRVTASGPRRRFIVMLALLPLLAAIGPQFAALHAQGTAFSYQGRLNDSGTPANGSYDLEFSLFTTNTGGSMAAGFLTNSATPVSNGLFTVTLDFGPGVFNGTAYWLQIGVRTNGTGGFVPLSPRQELTPAPYSIFAETAGALPGLTLEQNTNGAPNLIAGAAVNSVSSGVVGATIGGGGATNYFGVDANSVTGNFGTVGGGRINTAAGGATVAGGEFNSANAPDAAIGGGYGNTVTGNNGTVSGGLGNTAIGFASVGGGVFNVANNYEAAIAGGFLNTNAGLYSFIGGGSNNIIQGDVVEGVIGGGSANMLSGLSFVNFASVIAGGMGNLISQGVDYAMIGGGLSNQVTASYAAVAGGTGNSAGGYGSSISGGFVNTISASANYAFIGAGYENTNNGYGAFIGGGIHNQVPIYQDYYATLGGGLDNVASGPGAFVGGGGYDGFEIQGNTASGPASVVGGGLGNTAGSGSYATVAGGLGNTASGFEASVAGGNANVASGEGATVSGGNNNTADNVDAIVAGGEDNVAGGQYSFAAGIYARALHDDSFVWSDGESGTPGYSSDRANQFKIQAGGGVQLDVSGSSGLNPAALRVNSTSANGVGIFVAQDSSDATAVFTASGSGDILKGFSGSSGGNLVFEVVNSGTVYSKGVALTSDRNAKENFAPVDSAEILARVAALPISQWNYKTDPAAERHLGPVAQDFHAAFGLNGSDDKHISVVDEGGVALAAIQGLNQKVEGGKQKSEIRFEQLEDENTDLKAQVTDLRSQLASLQKAVAELTVKSGD